MKVYAVMITSWNGEYDVDQVYAVYADQTVAEKYVNDINEKLCSGGNRSAYAPNYWVEELDVIV